MAGQKLSRLPGNIIQYRPANWTIATQATPIKDNDLNDAKVVQKINLRQTYDAIPGHKKSGFQPKRDQTVNPNRTQYFQVMVDNRSYNNCEPSEAQNCKLLQQQLEQSTQLNSHLQGELAELRDIVAQTRNEICTMKDVNRNLLN